MKFLLLCFAVFVLTSATVLDHPSGTVVGRGFQVAASNLTEDFFDLYSCLPIRKWKELFERFYAEDSDIQNAVAYLKSDKFKKVVEVVDSAAEFKKVMDFIANHGVDSYGYLNKVHDLLGLPKINSTLTHSRHRRSLYLFYEEMEAFVSWKLLKYVWNRQLNISPDLQELYAMLKADEFHEFVQEVLKMTEVQEVLKYLRRRLIPLDDIAKFFNTFLGWTSA